MEADPGTNTPARPISPPPPPVSESAYRGDSSGAKTGENGAGTGNPAAKTQVTCAWCQRQFTTKSGLGRHLDRKKGDHEHPRDQVEDVRGFVRRRGPKAEISQPPPSRSAVSRRISAKRYNSQEEVKHRNKDRRRRRDLEARAKLEAYSWFVDRVQCVSHTRRDFPGIVAEFLPPQRWPPAGTAPGDTEMMHTVGIVSQTAPNLLPALLDGHSAWRALDAGQQLSAWQSASDSAVRTMGASLHELQHAGSMVAARQQHVYERLSVGPLYESDGESEVT